MMHYLKCENCGHLNPLQTEYLVFCTNCQKKLVTNFYDWHKNNSDKTFDDFKTIFAISETEFAKSQEPVKKSGGLKVWIYIAIAFSICFTLWIGYSVTKNVFQIMSIMNFSKSIGMLTDEWSTQEYCSGFSLSTPSPLTESGMELPEEVRGLIQEMGTFALSSGNNFTVAVNCILYLPDVGELNLQGAADGSAEQMKMQPGVTGFNYTEEVVEVSGIPGFVQRGTYEQNSQPLAFINTGYTKGFQLWQMLVIYKQDDDAGIISAERVYQSIQINHVSDPSPN